VVCEAPNRVKCEVSDRGGLASVDVKNFACHEAARFQIWGGINDICNVAQRLN
jgi:hypothetical protein